MLSYLSNFQVIRPFFEKDHKSILEWLKKAHLFSLEEKPEEKEAFLSTFQRLEIGTRKIQKRGTQIKDLELESWEAMSIFRLDLAPQGLNLTERTKLYSKEVLEIFKRFYPEGKTLPDHLIHVTCTGYASPSGAQNIVSLKKAHTQVTHAYHMGCYGAFPAIKMATGFLHTSSSPLSIDIVHTEMCSLHMNPSFHHKAQLVIESLFADGFIKYQVSKTRKNLSLGIVAFLEQIIPDSDQDMSWACHDWGFCMDMSKEVPYKIGAALPSFLQNLFDQAGLSLEEGLKKALFAIHPGGPKIIEQISYLFKLEPWQVEHSFEILSSCGNMSSATIPHIWDKMVYDANVVEGTFIVSLAFGPGLTCAGSIVQKQG